ncbi:hypothetical protein ASA1KI_09570 [Opitutales bacterium ASA1]|nr:hypothetical protein ASA1KI_09570 [Opitutales bacterium ASA1]
MSVAQEGDLVFVSEDGEEQEADGGIVIDDEDLHGDFPGRVELVVWANGANGAPQTTTATPDGGAQVEIGGCRANFCPETRTEA